jgi:murein DD-endopeptidase MepM/ murein hydrolase activator NlpD
MSEQTINCKTVRGRARGQVFRLLCALLAVFILLGSAPFAQQVQAVTQSEINKLKQQQSQLSSSKKAVQDKISAIQSDKSQAIKRKALVEQQIEYIRQELAVTNNLIAQLDQQIIDKTAELEAAIAEEARYEELFYQRVRDMEETGTVKYWAVLFNSKDFSDLLDQMNAISEIVAFDNQVMDDLAVARAAVADAKSQLELTRTDQQAAKEKLDATNQELKQQQAEVDALINEIKGKEKDYKDQYSVLENESADISKELQAAERLYAQQLAAQKAAQQQQGGNATLTGSGGFIWPLPGYTTVNSPYGWRTHPITGNRNFHTGVDIPAPSGTRINAAKAGTVIISTYNSSYGNYVVIAHPDNSRTLYAHMKSRGVAAGDSVGQGNAIGYVGTTGSSTGNHLHFEVWTGSSSSSRVNPMNFF